MDVQGDIQCTICLLTNRCVVCHISKFFAEGLHLIRVRAEAMQRACDLIPSGMVTVHLSHDSQLSLALSAATKYCKLDLKLDVPVVCQIASFLGPDCKVVAGNVEVIYFTFLFVFFIFCDFIAPYFAFYRLWSLL